ncbi:MAG: beta-phosphoglucomutase family hydrolase [Roseiflexaceae bacterium]|nr:beta-phosphoglucomutase family hydrolase [Roseiflexaceae bacterium]
MHASDGLPRAALWDMDGTLLDSAAYHWQAWHDTFAAEGRPLTYEEFVASFGQRNDTILRGLLGDDLPDAELARIGDAKEALYRQLVREQGVALLPGVRDWLGRLREAGFRQAVASAAPRANIEAILDALEIRPFFAAITSAEDVQRGKPDPQVFLLAAERLGVAPSRCVVLEDAPAGVEAGQRAGMRVIGVRSSHATLTADIAVDTLEQLPEDAFARLLG